MSNVVRSSAVPWSSSPNSFRTACLWNELNRLLSALVMANAHDPASTETRALFGE
ncbi:hypothetical protein AB1484_33265 [Parafrankia sp. FMc6]|uniref:hypothetical protein n=1 Tax=Parafrankia soli TaxID=2599596 RepID=UPI0034D4850E